MHDIRASRWSAHDISRELKHEIESERDPEPRIEEPEGPEPDEDAIDPADGKHLDAIRRMMGLGEVDDGLTQEH